MDNEFNGFDSEDIELNDDDYSDNEDKTPEITTQEASNERVEIVGIRFKKNGKTYYFAPGGFELNIDDRVIVDTAHGMEYGYTAVTNREINASEVVSPLRSVVRMATDEDTAIHEENLKKEIEAYNNCIALIVRHGLRMKLVDVEYAFDRSKLLFYFSADGRVDFRDLVRDLASIFHTRIEMRQIGIRDEAKLLGGLGICGRPFCCSSFLSDFVQVSVKMAKEQNLSLNSAKISGACGRLMCCLRYEYDTYLKEKAVTPKAGSRVMTPDGPGIVAESNPLTGIVKVKLDMLPEDAEKAVFVRDDLVYEDQYTGQTLTRTPIPERPHINEEEKTLFGLTENALIYEKDTSTDDSGEEPASERIDEGESTKNEKGNRRKPNRRTAARRYTDRDNGNASANTENTRTAEEKDQYRKNPKDERKPRRPLDKGTNKVKPARRDKKADNYDVSSEKAEQSIAENAEKKKNRRPKFRNFKKKRRYPGGDDDLTK